MSNLKSDVPLDLSKLPNEILKKLFGKFADTGLQISANTFPDMTQADQATTTNILIRTIYKDQNMSNRIILDTSANTGGNTVPFLELQPLSVISVEIDKNKFKMLQNNIDLSINKVYHLNSSDTKTDNHYEYNMDINYYVKNMRILPHIVFFDPPWGGSSYKDVKIIDELHYGQTGLRDLILNNFLTAETLICKLPPNYNFELLDKSINKYFNTRLIQFVRIAKNKTGQQQKSVFNLFIASKFNSIDTLKSIYEVEHIPPRQLLHDYYGYEY